MKLLLLPKKLFSLMMIYLYSFYFMTVLNISKNLVHDSARGPVW